MLNNHASKKRGKEVLESCGCACYCPQCKDILNDQADCKDETEEEKVYYRCNTCGHNSVWTFDAAPIPILLSDYPEVVIQETV